MRPVQTLLEDFMKLGGRRRASSVLASAIPPFPLSCSVSEIFHGVYIIFFDAIPADELRGARPILFRARRLNRQLQCETKKLYLRFIRDYQTLNIVRGNTNGREIEARKHVGLRFSFL